MGWDEDVIKNRVICPSLLTTIIQAASCKAAGKKVVGQFWQILSDFSATKKALEAMVALLSRVVLRASFFQPDERERIVWTLLVLGHSSAIRATELNFLVET